MNNDIQNTTPKTKDWVIRIPLITRDEVRCSGKVSSSCSTRGTRPVQSFNYAFVMHAYFTWTEHHYLFKIWHEFPHRENIQTNKNRTNNLLNTQGYSGDITYFSFAVCIVMSQRPQYFFKTRYIKQYLCNKYHCNTSNNYYIL